MATKNKKIFIGPIKDYPSWAWAGLDIARELSKYYEVALFSKFSDIKNADAVMIVKHRLTARILEEIKPKAKRVIYSPVDLWADEEDLIQSLPFLKELDLIFIHSERLLNRLKEFGINSIFVEHYNKYTIPKDLDYKESGKVLWIGGFEHAPFIVDYVEKYNLNLDLNMLTSPARGTALAQACRRYKQIGHHEDFKAHIKSLKNVMFMSWTERIQKDLMEHAKAGMDIKAPLLWSHIYKPPTKAQQFISSGIPFACNKESYSHEYFSKRGLEIPEPRDTNRWFSYEYWKETQKFKRVLEGLLSLSAVGQVYRSNLNLIL